MSVKYKPKECSENKGWFLIPGYSKYLANKDGYILTLKTMNYKLGGISNGYRRVSVYRDGDKEPILAYAHDLICRAFYGPPKEGQVVLHIDNSKINNKYKNVKWGTQKENIKQVWDDGLRESLESHFSYNW